MKLERRQVKGDVTLTYKITMDSKKEENVMVINAINVYFPL